jgi:hypothetical protein
MRFRLMALAGVTFGVGISGAVAASSPPTVPTSYNQTCELVSSWCSPPVTGSLPSTLRRPLLLPVVKPGQPCPVSHGREFSNSQFGGFAVGKGPVQPLVAGRHAVSWAVIRLTPFFNYGKGWYAVKTLWFGQPGYQGPLLIRGRRLDGTGRVVMGEGPSVIDPQIPPGLTVNGTGGWREWPGGTWLRKPGCYGWQVDGENFTTVIVFRAVFVH